jgi:hypothetical protein
MKTRSLALLFLPLLASLGGCTVVVGTSDTDVRVDGRWTINGGAATDKSCEAVGLDTVELYFYANETGSSGRKKIFTANCGNAAYTTGWEYAADYYYYEWIGYDADGAILIRSPQRTYLDMSLGGTAKVDVDFVLDQVGFPGGAATGIDAVFTVMDGLEPNTANCAYAGIDWVQMVILDTAETTEWTDPSLEALCVDGFIQTPDLLLEQGDYKYLFRAYDADDYLIYESDVFELRDSAVDPDGYFYAPSVDLYQGISIYATMRYETGPGTGYYTNCIGADADTTLFMWDLYDQDPRLVSGLTSIYRDDTDEGFYCLDQIVLDDTYALLEPGYTYYLEVASTSASGAKWGGVCEVAVDHAGYTDVTCDVGR